jgi:adenine-specific DNA-methyltransferase
MEKLKMHSPDLTQDNIAKIRGLFPGCVTEATDKNGAISLAVDFDQLRQELSDSIAEGPQERYRLDWPGKREALLATNSPLAKTLRPCIDESKDFEITSNIFVEGDNLEAMKLLQTSHLGLYQLVYLDPPYNTGKDFIYKDCAQETIMNYLISSNQVGADRTQFVANTAIDGRFHSNWLTMIYPRLRLARNLLADSGFIVVSIDDNELFSVKLLLDEIMGGENFIGVFSIVSSPSGIDYGHIAKTNDYAICYAKSIDNAKSNPLPDEDKSFKYLDEKGPFNIYPLYNGNTAFHPGNRPNLYYPFFVNPCKPSGNDFFEISLEQQSGWHEVFPVVSRKEGLDRVWRWGKDKARAGLNDEIVGHKTEQGEFRIVQKSRLDGKIIRSMIDDKRVSTRRATAELEELFGKKIFSFPKPIGLLEDFIMAFTGPDDRVADLFAGSSTCADAIFRVNAKFGGSRRFLAIQAPEKVLDEGAENAAGFSNIADLSKERIRLAGQRVLTGDCHQEWNKDAGFRVLKIDTSNMADVYYTPDATKQGDLLASVESIKQGRTAEDLLFQVLVDWGVDLTLPIRREAVQGKTVFFVDENALVACFDTGVTEELVKELAGHEPVRVVFRDTGFASDAVKINVEQIFRQLSPSTEVRAI